MDRQEAAFAVFTMPATASPTTPVNALTIAANAYSGPVYPLA
jgi:hypothetical protein